MEFPKKISTKVIISCAMSRNNLVDVVGQSAPVDTTVPYDASLVSGKTILITGGASGFGEGFFRKWAENGQLCISDFTLHVLST